MTSNFELTTPLAAVILAAGASTRMGTPKQLLPYRQGTLLQNAIEQTVEAGFSRVVVVVGAHLTEIRASISDLTAEVVENEHWEHGMGSSIVAGVKHVTGLNVPLGGIAILLGDQPLIRSEHLLAMRRLFEECDSPIVAARYGGTLGVPAFFRMDLLGALEGLPPSSGARHILNFPGAKVVPFDLPEAAVDIDTPEEFESLKHSS